MCQVLHDRKTDRLLVIEMLTVPGGPNPGIAVLDMMMLLYVGEARPRTVAEYSELFRATRLEYSRLMSTSSAFSIVEARRLTENVPSIAQRRRMNVWQVALLRVGSGPTTSRGV